MDLLKKEMERKRQALISAKKKTSGSRFVKASELRRFLEDDQDEKAQQLVIEASNERKREREDTSKQLDEHQTQDLHPVGKILKNGDEKRLGESTNQQSSLEQVIRQLRSFGLPVALFGEGLADRRRRLEAALTNKAAQQSMASEADEFRLGQGHSIRNPFLEKEADTDDAAATAAAAADFAPREEEERKREASRQAKRKEEDDDDVPDPHKDVYRHFKGLLSQWEADLNARPDDVKRSLAGRNETKTVKQCKDYIRPLFQLCKRRQLEGNLLTKLHQMVDYCHQGEFVRAHDAYMDVAIGRAVWPIGVTMVGIHARTGRSKIESSNVAHVMNSELQRKYLTSVKRLLTYEQKKRTDVDPSKKVMN